MVTPNSYFTSQSRRSKICSYLAQFGALNRSARMEWVWESGMGMGMGGRGAKKSNQRLVSQSVPRCGPVMLPATLSAGNYPKTASHVACRRYTQYALYGTAYETHKSSISVHRLKY